MCVCEENGNSQPSYTPAGVHVPPVCKGIKFAHSRLHTVHVCEALFNNLTKCEALLNLNIAHSTCV